MMNNPFAPKPTEFAQGAASTRFKSTEYEQQRLAEIRAKNEQAPVLDTTFLLDYIRKMDNHQTGLTGLGAL